MFVENKSASVLPYSNLFPMSFVRVYSAARCQGEVCPIALPSPGGGLDAQASCPSIRRWRETFRSLR